MTSFFTALEKKIVLAHRMREHVIPAVEQLNELRPSVALSVINAQYEVLVASIRDEMYPSFLTWREVLDTSRVTAGHIAAACGLAASAGYPYVLWNDRVYPSNTAWHRYLSDDNPAPRMQALGLGTATENCVHTHRTQIEDGNVALWCQDCGALQMNGLWLRSKATAR